MTHHDITARLTPGDTLVIDGTSFYFTSRKGDDLNFRTASHPKETTYRDTELAEKVAEADHIAIYR